MITMWVSYPIPAQHLNGATSYGMHVGTESKAEALRLAQHSTSLMPSDFVKALAQADAEEVVWVCPDIFTCQCHTREANEVTQRCWSNVAQQRLNV